MLEIKGQVLPCVCLHLKVPGWLSDLNYVLLTRKLPTFLPHLNEISVGRGNMCLVLGSMQRILKLPYLPLYNAHFFPAEKAPKIEMRIIHGILCFTLASLISM